MNVREALKEAGEKLKSNPEGGGGPASRDAQIILEHTLKKPRGFALAHPEAEITREDFAVFLRHIERRAAGICTAYITGHKAFMQLDLIVNEDVLVPRPDTETLVEAALELSGGLSSGRPGFSDATGSPSLKILDLGTGSGAIALALRAGRGDVEVHASDISEKALETARRNLERETGKSGGQDAGGISPPSVPGLRPRLCSRASRHAVRFIHSDLFQNITESYDIIVSNPPYIPSKMIDTLPPEVRNEPRLALDGGEDGLVVIRKIIAGAPRRLNPGGFLLLEACPSQMPEISSLLRGSGFEDIVIKKDLSGAERVIRARADGP